MRTAMTSAPDTRLLSETVSVVIVGIVASTASQRVVIEEVAPGEIPAERLAYWNAQPREVRGDTIGLHVATMFKSVTLRTDGWEPGEDDGHLTQPVPVFAPRGQR